MLSLAWLNILRSEEQTRQIFMLPTLNRDKVRKTKEISSTEV